MTKSYNHHTSKKLFNRARYILALFVFLFNFSKSEIVDLEKKCIWILRDTLTSPEKIERAFDHVVSAGYNIVFLQIRGRGYAFYESTLVPKNPRIIDGFDPLQYSIDIAKENNIEIHVWFNTYILWSARSTPENSKHIYHSKGEWTEANKYGKMDYKINLKSPKIPNWEGVYLSPIHPEVNPYLNSLIQELIDNYTFQGIHFDYIRYQDEIYGYNRKGTDVFEELFSIDPYNIAKGIISTRFGWSKEFVDSTQNMWTKFKQNAITSFLETVSNSVFESGKNIELSAAVKPNLLIAKTRFFQDWELWLNNDILDFVVPMNYYPKLKDFNDDIQIMKYFINSKYREKIVMGLATYNQSASDVADKILISRMQGFKGISIFSYDAHQNNLDWFNPILHAIDYNNKELYEN